MKWSTKTQDSNSPGAKKGDYVVAEFQTKNVEWFGICWMSQLILYVYILIECSFDIRSGLKIFLCSVQKRKLIV